MPAQWNLPTTANGNWTVQDVNRFNALPFWAAQQQVKQLPYFSRWGNLFSTQKWDANKGNVLLGIIDEFSPKTSQVHKPTFITSTPLRTVSSTFQRTNTGRIYRHKFESELFSFLPSFTDFARQPLKHATMDINRQIAFGNDDFIRWQAFQLAPAVWQAGNSTRLNTSVPVGPPGEGDLADPKTAAVIATLISGVTGPLDFKEICAVRSAARYDLGLVPWDGVPGAPGDNEILGGRWLLMGEGLIYEAMSYDTHILNTRMLTQDLQHKEWMGIIGGNIVFREEKYPLRFKLDGTMPAPEIEQVLPVNGTITSGSSTITNPGGAAKNVEIIPNPDYVNAPIGVAWFMGHEPMQTLSIGAPPSEFANAKVDTARIGKLSWNGEVRLTDNVLVNYGGAGGTSITNIDTNKYGEVLQLIADTVMGVIPVTMRRCIPILYARNKYPSLTSQT